MHPSWSSFLEILWKSLKGIQSIFWKHWQNDASTLHKKMKFSIKDLFSKCDQIRRFLRIWSNLLKKSLMENFIFCAVRRIKMQEFAIKNDVSIQIIHFLISFYVTLLAWLLSSAKKTLILISTIDLILLISIQQIVSPESFKK